VQWLGSFNLNKKSVEFEIIIIHKIFIWQKEVQVLVTRRKNLPTNHQKGLKPSDLCLRKKPRKKSVNKAKSHPSRGGFLFYWIPDFGAGMA